MPITTLIDLEPGTQVAQYWAGPAEACGDTQAPEDVAPPAPRLAGEAGPATSAPAHAKNEPQGSAEPAAGAAPPGPRRAEQAAGGEPGANGPQRRPKSRSRTADKFMRALEGGRVGGPKGFPKEVTKLAAQLIHRRPGQEEVIVPASLASRYERASFRRATSSR